MNIKHCIHRLLLVIVAIPVILIAIFWIERLFGYYPGGVAWEVGEIAAREKNVDLCERIIIVPWIGFPIGPTTDDQRISCIHEYASLAKDPTACERLMPSSYGLDCVGSAKKKTDPCVMRYEGISWSDGSSTYNDCRTDSAHRSAEGNRCCLIARVSFVQSENDCSPLSKFPEMMDECLSNLAFKKHEPNYCTGVQDQSLKTGCLINAQAMQENPGICTACKAHVERLEELR